VEQQADVLAAPLVTGWMYGEMPGTTPGPPLGGRNGELLAELCGLDDYNHLRDMFCVRNLVPARPDDGRWPRHEARVRAMFQIAGWSDGDQIVLLGAHVRDAFGLDGKPLTSLEVPLTSGHQAEVPSGSGPLGVSEGGRLGTAPTAVVHLVPHPSGRNRWWNEPENRERASRLLKKVVMVVRDERSAR